jgi:hypothetical protein
LPEAFASPVANRLGALSGLKLVTNGVEH